MPLHLLGVSRGVDVAGLSHPWGGGQKSEVRWVVEGPLAAAAVEPGDESFGPLEQARLLAAIHRQIAIRPLRYGTVLPQETAVRDFLSRRGASLLRDLLRIEGTGEIGVRVELLGPAGASSSCLRETDDNRLPAMSPRQYLALRRQCYEWKDQLDGQAQRVTENFVQAVQGLYRQWRVLTSTVPTTVRLAFLVQREHWEAFCHRLETIPPSQACQRYTIVGPWPPYSFV
jgi:hypothetical protein